MDVFGTKFFELLKNNLPLVIKDTSVEMATMRDQSLLAKSQMAIILVASYEFKIFLKVHFSEQDLSEVPGQNFEAHPEGEFEGRADYAREVTNQLAGALRTVFGKHQIDCSMSLPLNIRSFDDIFLELPNIYFVSLFKVNIGSKHVYLQFQTEVLEMGFIQTFEEIDFSTPIVTSEAEFL